MNPLAAIINKYALACNLRPDIVACVILQESGGDTMACRYEKQFYETYLANKAKAQLAGFVPPKASLDTEKNGRAISWGLMQVMGDTARWCAKFSGNFFTSLCDPDIGVRVGCLVLAHDLEMEKGNYIAALSRYNSGTSNSTLGLKYANEVLARALRKEHLTILQ